MSPNPDDIAEQLAFERGLKQRTPEPFPVRVERVMESNEELDVVAPGVRFRLCAHGARALALMLTDKADQLYCDGYRHGDDSTMYSCTILGGYERPKLGKAHASCKG